MWMDYLTIYHVSVSGIISLRCEVFKMADFLEVELKALGATVRKVPLGKQQGEDVDLPPVILAQVGNFKDPSKKTILCYGHYDVQPVSSWLRVTLHLLTSAFIRWDHRRR
jgi:acetylornithine deacetylase/succinyl-diaminopimelate desuccinylase-like protein